jgi:hypothetical protein
MAAANFIGVHEMHSSPGRPIRSLIWEWPGKKIHAGKKENSMKSTLGLFKLILGVGLLAAIFVPLANSQCVNTIGYKRSALMLRQQPWSGIFTPAAFFSAAPADVEASSDTTGEPIVGFWKVTLISKGNDGIPDDTVLDSAFAQWHSDGTEIMNSSRPPITGSFCLGVWKKTGPSFYKLNHFAISWNPDGTLLGPANIHERVTLSADHNSFVGNFTIDQYNSAGNLQVHLAGRLVGKRITVNTTITDVL